MKAIWNSSLDGYCLRRQRLEKADKLLTQKVHVSENQADRLAVQDAIDDITDSRASTQGLQEAAQSVKHFMDRILHQAIEFDLRKKLSQVRYHLEPLTPFQMKREQRLLETEAGLDKKTIGFKRMVEDHEDNNMLAEAYDGFESSADELDAEQETIQKHGERLK